MNKLSLIYPIYIYILDSVDSKKETANAIEGLVHPCGGPGWKQVEFSDFSYSDTSCPMPDLVQSVLMRDLTHVAPITYDTSSFLVDASYNRVCGCIKAYQLQGFI